MHTTKRVAASEEYCFTMTGDTGDRTHGFCRKIYWSPSPKEGKFPIVLCVISDELWSIFHFKVLEVLEQLLVQERFISTTPGSALSATSAAVRFLQSVNQQLSEGSQPGEILKVPFPDVPDRLRIEAPQKIIALFNPQSEGLKSTAELIELQVPPLTGGSPAMAGVSLARLLWRIPVQCLVTLIASLLLERRIIMVCKTKDTLSAAIHAASALIYPFEWPHRFYLPIMPETMRHYLQAPFPFLVGLPAELMDFKGLEMDEVTLIDLDLGTCTPEPGSPYDDAMHLPMRHKLEEALHLAVRALRSPTEFEGNTRIAEIITGYVVRLFKNYRQFIKRKGDAIDQIQQRGCLSRGKQLLRLSGKGTTNTRGVSVPISPVSALEDTMDESCIDGHGHIFDHAKFVASHRSKKDRAFLEMFRESQMYEVFIRQRLEMESLGEYPKEDAFEYKISLIGEYGKRLVPVEQPQRQWSRKLSVAHAPQKFASFAGPRIRKTRTHVQDDVPFDLQGDGQGDKSATSTLETVSKRRLLTPRRGRDARFSKAQSIKKIVTEMAKESSKKLAKPEPGNYLQRSRASLVFQEIEDIPEYRHDATVSYQRPISPLMSMMTDEEDGSASTESSDAIVPTSVRQRSSGYSSPPSMELSHPSPWDASPEEHVFDAWTAQSEETKRPKDDWFASSYEETVRAMDSISLPKSSVAASSEGTESQGDGDERQETKTTGGGEKKNQADAFLESNLIGLSSNVTVKLGLPPKPQRSPKPQT